MMRFIRYLLVILTFTTGTSAFAASHSIGIDVIRLLDEHQLVGESFNLFYQHGLQGRSAAVFGLARDGNDGTMLEAAFKAYTGQPFASVYYQAGGNLFDNNDETDLGFHAAIGYEQSPAKNFTFFGAAKVIVIPDTDYTQFSPMLGAMFSF